MLFEALAVTNGVTFFDLVRRMYLRNYLPITRKLPNPKKLDSSSGEVDLTADFIYQYEVNDQPVYEYNGEKYPGVLLSTYQLKSDAFSNVLGVLFLMDFNPLGLLFLNSESEEERYFRTVRNRHLNKYNIDFEEAKFDQSNSVTMTLPGSELRTFLRERNYQVPVDEDYSYKVKRTFLTRKQPIYLNMRYNGNQQRFVCRAISPCLRYARTRSYPVGVHAAILGTSAFFYSIHRSFN